jgi:DNA polymerase V
MVHPLHHLKDNIRAHGIRVLSSNYTLYGDVSRRVSEVYEDFSPRVEVYSIDECFLDFGGFRDREAHAKVLVADVKRRVGFLFEWTLGHQRPWQSAAMKSPRRIPSFIASVT